jgi:FkbM family methyltransferase
MRRLVWWLLRHAADPWAMRVRRLPLVGRAVHAVSHSVWSPGTRAWVRVQRGPAEGIELLLDLRYDAKLREGDLEPELQARLPKLVPPGSTVWDVGAHAGFFTLLCARLVGKEGRVVAFEPDDANVEALRAAASRNGFDTVEIRPVAVWSTPGSVGFERRSDSAEGAHGAVVADAVVTVPATTLDLEFEQRGDPTLVKIDVEGGEVDVLRGAQQLLAERRPIVLCEVHVARRGREELLPLVLDLFERAAYDVEEIVPGRRPAHLVAIPRNSA